MASIVTLAVKLSPAPQPPTQTQSSPAPARQAARSAFAEYWRWLQGRAFPSPLGRWQRPVTEEWITVEIVQGDWLGSAAKFFCLSDLNLQLLSVVRVTFLLASFFCKSIVLFVLTTKEFSSEKIPVLSDYHSQKKEQG
jgi:hypothetical protein